MVDTQGRSRYIPYRAFAESIVKGTSFDNEDEINELVDRFADAVFEWQHAKMSMCSTWDEDSGWTHDEHIPELVESQDARIKRLQLELADALLRHPDAVTTLDGRSMNVKIP
jgi:hypothetical protein